MLSTIVLTAAILMTIISVLVTWVWIMKVSAIIDTMSGSAKLSFWPHLIATMLWILYASL